MLKIKGYASTNTKDRTNEVIEPTAWQEGLANYASNPVLLFQHDHANPVGKVLSLSIDEKGLFVEAEISNTADKLQSLVNEEVLKAFSVGFALKDGEYERKTDTFVIKSAELLELSIVSIPCNPTALFEREVS